LEGDQEVAVKIRLKRMGAKKRPFYRVVVADARSPRDGRFIESVGYYDPLREPKVVKLDDERIRQWMATGAKPSDAVRELLERAGMIESRPRPARPAAAGAQSSDPVAADADGQVAEEVSAEPEAEALDQAAAAQGPESEATAEQAVVEEPSDA
jgi:small subunit ribosomal protein S16